MTNGVKNEKESLVYLERALYQFCLLVTGDGFAPAVDEYNKRLEKVKSAFASFRRLSKNKLALSTSEHLHRALYEIGTPPVVDGGRVQFSDVDKIEHLNAIRCALSLTIDKRGIIRENVQSKIASRVLKEKKRLEKTT